MDSQGSKTNSKDSLLCVPSQVSTWRQFRKEVIPDDPPVLQELPGLPMLPQEPPQDDRTEDEGLKGEASTNNECQVPNGSLDLP